MGEAGRQTGQGWDRCSTSSASFTPMDGVDVRRRTLRGTLGGTRQRSLSAGSDVKCGGGPVGTYVYIQSLCKDSHSPRMLSARAIYIIEAGGSVDKTCMILTVESGKQSHEVGSTFTARREQRPERGYMNALRRIPVTVEQQPKKMRLVAGRKQACLQRREGGPFLRNLPHRELRQFRLRKRAHSLRVIVHVCSTSRVCLPGLIIFSTSGCF